MNIVVDNKPGASTHIGAQDADIENVCAALAVTEQESSFQADPQVPGLADIARRKIDQRAAREGV